MHSRLTLISLLVLIASALIGCTVQTRAITPPAGITVTVSIVDATTEQPLIGNVLLDGQRVATGVSDQIVNVPADMQAHEVRVEVPGCKAWGLAVRSPDGHPHTMRGPARLTCGAKRETT